MVSGPLTVSVALVLPGAAVSLTRALAVSACSTPPCDTVKPLLPRPLTSTDPPLLVSVPRLDKTAVLMLSDVLAASALPDATDSVPELAVNVTPAPVPLLENEPVPDKASPLAPVTFTGPPDA